VRQDESLGCSPRNGVSVILALKAHQIDSRADLLQVPSRGRIGRAVCSGSIAWTAGISGMMPCPGPSSEAPSAQRRVAQIQFLGLHPQAFILPRLRRSEPRNEKRETRNQKRDTRPAYSCLTPSGETRTLGIASIHLLPSGASHRTALDIIRRISGW
jgi:hypothetical protein